MLHSTTAAAEFTVTDRSLVGACLDEYGVCVVRGVVREHLLVGLDEALVDAMARPAIHGRAQPSLVGMVDVFHDPRQWALRQDPDVVAVFQAAVGCEEVWMSIDRLSYKLPTTQRRDVRFLHWDDEPAWAAEARARGQRAVQGLVYLSDVATNGGAFHCIPESRSAAWRAAQESAHPLEMTPGGPVLPDAVSATSVPGLRGDIVIWGYDVAHGAGENFSSVARRVAYLTAQPAGGDEDRRAHAAMVAEAAPPAWVSYPTATEVPFTEFTQLGERIAGLVAW